MYSDVSDDEDFFDYDHVYLESPSWPHLQLYEEDEYEMKRYAVDNVRKQVEAGTPPWKIVREDYYRFERTKRFFKSIQGFHKGDLDLTGRHKPRYESLIKRLNALLEDYRDLSHTVDAKEVEETKEITDGYSFTHKYMDYRMKNLIKWVDFVNKWHVCYVGYGALKSQIEETLDIISQRPSPIYQELCLLDLPEEILDLIFSYATLEKARLLSSTCHKLREIGRPYIFTDRKLTLDLPSDFGKRKEKIDAADVPEFLMDTIKSCRTELLNRAAFLLERPDLMDVTSKLWISIYTKEYDVELDDDFYEPIYQAFANVILNCRNLKYLGFSCVDLSIELFQAIVSLPQLLVLDMRACLIPQQVVTGIFNGTITPSPSVLNLLVFEIGEPKFEIWTPVLLFPNLRTLSMCNLGAEHGLELQPPEMLQVPGRRSNVLSSMERLSLKCIDNDVVVSLTRWIELNTAEPALKLTHLKLSAVVGLEEQFLIQLFDAMRNSPLRVLVLDGIREGSLVLFDRIAANCPNLLGLTVFRRENMRQRVTKPATWPHTTYEYAARFSAFQHLEHFSWNFRIRTSTGELPPACIRYLEEGFMSEEELHEMYFRRENVVPESDYFRDGYYAAYPFAAHCPTLKSFSIMPKNLPDDFCYIKRKDNGSIELIQVDVLTDSDAYDYLRSWDINLDFHWPLIIPTSNSQVEEVS